MYQVASKWNDKPGFLTLSNTKLLISMSAACMNLIVIVIFNKVISYFLSHGTVIEGLAGYKRGSSLKILVAGGSS